MRCKKCRARTKVIDSRPGPRGVRRRRLCPKCKTRFTTYESETKPARLATIKRLLGEIVL